jgi:transcriptional repressor NrdR
MRCPYCEHPESRVIDSREAAEGIRRRRECLRCGLRFTTQERLQATALLVVKRDGRREEFDREKVRGGLLRACAKRPVSIDAIEGLCDQVERELARLNRAEAPSALIGQLVMEGLRGLDHVAYVRFASVYRNFQGVASFAQEVESLLSDGGQLRPQEPQAQLPLPMSGDGAKPKRKGRGSEQRAATGEKPAVAHPEPARPESA